MLDYRLFLAYHTDGKEYTRTGMSKNLASCLRKQPAESIEDDQHFSLHLLVLTCYPSDY